jgi:glycosyltransferase involved in cell wall biosynthesis
MRKKVSVAMAVFNGEKYLNEQIDSIIPQLFPEDELIISYDNSTDNSFNIIKAYASRDKRIKYYKNEIKPGVVKNFENAVTYCTGGIIFYSDQDDVWMPDKIKKVLSKFEDPNVTVVIHDSSLTDRELNITHPSTFKLRNGNTSLFKNFIRLSYIGCCLAFRSDMRKVVLPIPTIYRSHDWWTGSICSCYGKMEKIDEALILHRLHDNNATPVRRPPLRYQLSVRWIIIINLIKRRFTHKKK